MLPDAPKVPHEAVAEPDLAAPEPAPPAATAAPVSPVKEWAVALALMIVFGIIVAQFVSFIRSGSYAGPP